MNCSLRSPLPAHIAYAYVSAPELHTLRFQVVETGPGVQPADARSIGRRQRFFEKVQAVLSPEELIAEDVARRAEHPCRNRAVGQCGVGAGHLVGARLAEQGLGVEAAGLQDIGECLRTRDVR